jgi:hypothetical protein
MKRQLTAIALKSYQAAPPAVQQAFDKRVKLLPENLQRCLDPDTIAILSSRNRRVLI